MIARVIALGIVDARHLAGTAVATTAWSDLAERSPGGPRTLRRLFGRADETFRRLDATSRALVLAAEAAGVERVLSPDERRDAALVVETCLGSLDSDIRFARSLAAGMCAGPTFAYTLPSTCLGEVALRLGVRGPSICFSVMDDSRGSALAEGERLIASGEARFAITASVDVLREADVPRPAECRAVVAVLTAATAETRSILPWPGGSNHREETHGARGTHDPFGRLAEAFLRRPNET